MEYNRTYWQAREGTKLNKFTKVNETTSTVELVNSPDAITIAGTEVTTDRLNNMEYGIDGAVAGMNEIQGVIDFTNMIDFSSGLGQLPRGWFGMTTLGNDVYVSVAGGDIYKQTNGTGDFIALGQASRSWYGMTTLGNDVYACVYGGDIYKQTNGVGDFIALGQETRFWQGMTTLGSDVYACVQFGDIYKQTNGVGDFVALGQTSRGWNGMTTLGNDVYACVLNGDIYKQTGGIGNFIALGQETRGWRGMTALGNDVYACVSNGDIYKQTNGTGDFIALGQASRSWYGMTTLDSVLYACVYNGDIYTAPLLSGNTFRASSSFTLPAMPDGARKRILNTHTTNAITVTAYAGTTIEGQATMTLSAGHEVEIELIGTVWRKTGWNEKALLTYSAPVDCTSRVAEYTGDGIPLIPDNVAGRTYFQDVWTTIDGWTTDHPSISLSVENSMLKMVYDGTRPDIGLSIANSGLAYDNKFIVGKIKSTVPIIRVGYYDGTTHTSLKIDKTNSYETVFYGYMTSPISKLTLYINYGQLTAKTGWLGSLYIGTGAYDTPDLDRAGNGNNLTLNAVTPVNGKYGKEMSFNGTTSYAQASSPVIGTTGTVAVRFKVADTISAYNLFDTRNGATNSYGIALLVSAGVLAIRFAGATQQNFNLASGIGTGYRTVIIAFDTSNIYFYLEGALISTTAITVSGFTHTNNLLLGKGQSTTVPAPLNGIISHFRYDSRIWTADEARAWSLNPISIDSRV